MNKCRFCLCDLNNQLPNVSSDYLRNKITKIGIKISSNIPLVICDGCLLFIEKIDEFLETVYKSEIVLSSLYNSTTNVSSSSDLSNSNNDINYTEEIKNSKNGITNKISQEVVEHDESISETREIKEKNVFQCIKENQLYTCEICSEKFDDFFNYQDHQETHNGQFVFHCSKCNKVFSSRSEIVQHENNHKVSCVICRTEVLPKSLDAHMIKHTDIFKCSSCGSRHSSRAALENHFKARHAGLKGYICYMCGKQNSCQASMNRHLATHLQIRPFKCKMCNFATKSKTILSVHVSRKHSNEKCNCEICGKLFKSKFSLKQHKKRIHSPKKFVCKQCGKSFSEKFNWNQHMIKKHSKERVYECRVCHQEFFTSNNLKNHMHVHRTGCVNCFKCGKVFIYKKYLEKHLMKCQGVKIKTETVNVTIV
ncbi:zinc finger protein OZF-like isoform X1 [Diorhabda sublineata]|uniref:zinc finger protein OZF-like isoform X1 n=1 Tax=Diorhabda sublineata TaxID=1163346 RepID=UPI0024E06D18|nr:zinc finger protein OZF-like isoform X1 [Diorhabda sublineata]